MMAMNPLLDLAKIKESDVEAMHCYSVPLLCSDTFIILFLGCELCICIPNTGSTFSQSTTDIMVHLYDSVPFTISQFISYCVYVGGKTTSNMQHDNDTFNIIEHTNSMFKNSCSFPQVGPISVLSNVLVKLASTTALIFSASLPA